MDRRPYSTLRPADVPGRRWPFDHDFFLLLNLAVSGDWPRNRNDDPELPATLAVDWIRVYDSAVTGG